jgi:hypothetical protein
VTKATIVYDYLSSCDKILRIKQLDLFLVIFYVRMIDKRTVAHEPMAMFLQNNA